MFLNKINLTYCLVVYFVVCPCLRPFWSVFLLAVEQQNSANSPRTFQNGLTGGQTTKNQENKVRDLWPLTCNATFESNALRKCNASVNSTFAQAPPGQLRGICPPCQSRGWGIWKFCTAWGPGICQPPDHFRAFDTHADFYQNITTQKVLPQKMKIGSSIKDRNKL